MLVLQSELTTSFGLNSQTSRTQSKLSQRRSLSRQLILSPQQKQKQRTSPTTALNVWWFGGTEQNEQQNEDDESCELVAVRIEKPTSNSRKIAGELSVQGVTVEDVWSILTDYDRLSIHVPNLKESKIVRENSKYGTPGDGSYKCQLYQVGAQKIIGFDFSASVTMDMTEQILSASTSNARKIHFRCAKSQFFSTFDGSWTVQEQQNPATGEPEVLCSYDVLVKPKGPVPVAALEWRIREDVPTNLRAVKAATMKKVSMHAQNEIKTVQNLSSSRKLMESRQPRQLATVMVDWERGETMAKYLE